MMVIPALFGRPLRPGWSEVDVELYEFDGSIGSELTDHRERRYERSCGDQDPVVITAWDDRR